jgi:hypothetical protein
MLRNISALSVQRRAYVELQSHVQNAKLSDKIVRGPIAKTFYKHPTFVMSREKMLSTIWVDIGVFKYSVNVLVPFFSLAYFVKA